MVSFKNETILFLDGEGKHLRKSNRKHYLTSPFLNKRRVCPAIHLAEVEVFSAFIQIFANCSVEPSLDGMPDIKHVQNIGINLLPPPYKVKFVKRMTDMASI